jgi:two-component system chemotaxis response regulator CheB
VRTEPAVTRSEQRSAQAVLPVVAIAASAGGIQALTVVLDALTPSFPAAVLVVLHISPRHPSQLASVLQRHASVPVADAADLERPVPGHVYLAPADRHLLLGADGRLHLSRADAVHFARPAADVLFDSVAEAAGHNAIGVVLSGTGRDGALGARHIKEAGGFTIAQDEDTAGFWGMPGSAVMSGAVDRVLPIGQIAALLRSLAGDLARPAS